MHESIADEFERRLVERVKKMKLTPGLDYDAASHIVEVQIGEPQQPRRGKHREHERPGNANWRIVVVRGRR